MGLAVHGIPEKYDDPGSYLGSIATRDSLAVREIMTQPALSSLKLLGPLATGAGISRY